VSELLFEELGELGMLHIEHRKNLSWFLPTAGLEPTA
jgi:hypothetical protein